MIERLITVNAEDLRQHPLGGPLHKVSDDCAGQGCRPVTVSVVPKIDEPSVGGVVRDANGTYLHTGSSFAKHWRLVGGKPQQDLRSWDQLADDVELVRPSLSEIVNTVPSASAPRGWLFELPSRRPVFEV